MMHAQRPIVVMDTKTRRTKEKSGRKAAMTVTEKEVSERTRRRRGTETNEQWLLLWTFEGQRKPHSEYTATHLVDEQSW